MNCTSEIRPQFQFDCYGRLYAAIAQALLLWGGAAGEIVVRRSVAKYGMEKGRMLRQVHIQTAVGINLQSLFHAERVCGEDPRFFRNILRDTDAVQLQEVYSCPLARLWHALGCEKYGFFYCEEYLHALVCGYTDGKGQANLSNTLMYPRDSRCVMACYLRPGNLPETARAQFAGGAPKRSACILRDILLLYQAFYQCAEEQEADAVAAVARGLRDFTGQLSSALTLEANHIGVSPGRDFLDAFCPIPLNSCDGALPVRLSGKADEIFRINVTQVLSRSLLDQEA